MHCNILRSSAKCLGLFVFRRAVWGRHATRKLRRQRQIGKKLTGLSLWLFLPWERAVLQADRRKCRRYRESESKSWQSSIKEVHKNSSSTGTTTRPYLSPLSMCSRTAWGNGRDVRVEMSGPRARSLSLLGPDAGAFLLSRCTESSFPLPSLSLLVCWSVVLLDDRSGGDWGWFDVGVLGPFSGWGGEGGRPFLDEWLAFGLGWWADDEPLVGVDVLLEFLALAAASAALAFFCLLSSAARLVLKVRVLGERLEGRLRERECRWRLRERECLEDEYGLLLRDLADRLEGKWHGELFILFCYYRLQATVYLREIKKKNLLLSKF